MEQVFLNDRLVNAEAARVSVHDAGLLHGVGLFETMRGYAGRVFRLDAHLERLYQSAARLGIAVTQSRDELAAGLRELVAANGLRDARLRLTVTRGSLRQDAEGISTAIGTATAMTAYPAEYYRYGMMVLVCPYKQNGADPTAGHKTLNYFPRLLAMQQAQQHRAGEALWFTVDHRLAEGCVSNVFLVKDGVLLTPPLDTPVLGGIVRADVLDLAEAEGVQCVQRPLTVDDLLGAEEVFLTNSVMELMPVCRIEKHVVGQDQPGPIYGRLHDAYRAAVQAECGDEAYGPQERPPDNPATN